MLKSIEKFWQLLLDTVLPPRTDFAIVQKLDEKAVLALPKALPVLGMDWISPLFQYKNNKVRAIVWELKYENNTKPLEYIGKILYEEIIATISDVSLFDSDAQFVLIPIPISPERRSERGYNQSEYICRSIVGCDTSHILLYAPQWFLKVKETSEQNKSHSREKRMQNLVGCFEANQNVAGKYIILIDDVVTTGSTLSEARRTLLDSGAKDVLAFTIAH